MVQEILFVAPYAKPERGASVIRVHSMADTLRQSGFQVAIFSPKRKASSNPAVFRYESWWELFFRILRGNFRAVIGISPPLPPNFFAMLACKVKGIPFMLDAKDDPIALAPSMEDALSKKIKRKCYLFLRGLTYRHSNALLFLTEEDLELEKKRYHLKQPLILLPNGTNPVFFDCSANVSKKMRRELGIPLDATTVLYAGDTGLEEVEEFVGALSNPIRKANVFVLLILSHDGSRQNEQWLNELQGKIQQEGLAKQCKILQNIPYEEIGPFFCASDIAVCPLPNLLVTSLAVKIFDYGAASLPILAKGAETGPVYRLFKRFEIGLYAADWDSFAKNFGFLLQNPKERKRMGRNARQMVETNFVRSENNLKLVKALKKLAP